MIPQFSLLDRRFPRYNDSMKGIAMDEQADLGLDSVSLPTGSMESSLFAQLPDLQAASAIGSQGGMCRPGAIVPLDITDITTANSPIRWVITLVTMLSTAR